MDALGLMGRADRLIARIHGGDMSNETAEEYAEVLRRLRVEVEGGRRAGLFNGVVAALRRVRRFLSGQR